METQEYSYRVPIGPNNPALKEPVSFDLKIEGEEIVDVVVKPGWVHRGIEYLATKRNPIQVIYLAERICGICSVTHAFNFVRVVEDAMDMEIPPRAEYIRTIVAELERIHSHILWAGYAGHIMGFDTLFHYSWKERESVLDVLEAMCGNRVNYGIMTIGGVRRDITPEIEKMTRESIKRWVEIFKHYAEAFLEDPMIYARTRNVGILTEKDAYELCALGPTLRGSGIPADIRQDQPYAAYGDIGFEAIVPQKIHGKVIGDVYDKITVRLYEVKQACEIIEKCLDALPEGDIVVEPRVARVLPMLKKASGEGISSIEGPRGEDFHYVKLEEGNENITAWKVRAPTYSNLMTWKPMMIGSQIADVPLIVASVDPCMSCTDRVTVTDVRKGTSSILTEEDLRIMSVEKTRRLMR